MPPSDDYLELYTRDISIPQESWFGVYEFDLRADPLLVKGGFRKKSIGSCQYFVNNLPVVCGHWANDKCGYPASKDDIPSGYNNGRCDFMGRRAQCSHYSGSGVDNAYHCIAINPFLSGVLSGGHAVSKDAVTGYNDGKCDGFGFGRGVVVREDDFDKLLTMPVKCIYYRPWQMGTGHIMPASYANIIKKYGQIQSHTASYQEALESGESMQYRLPFYFEVANLRAWTQKCLYWDQDYGNTFYVETRNVKFAAFSVMTAYARGLDKKTIAPGHQLPESDKELADEFRKKFLQPDSEKLHSLAQDIVSGASTDDEKAHAILTWTHANLPYVSDKTNWNKDDVWSPPTVTLKKGSGDCEDGAFLVHSLLLHAGVSSDKVRTYAGEVTSGGAAKTAGHAWTAYKRDSDGEWVPLDTSHLPTDDPVDTIKPMKYDDSYIDDWFYFTKDKWYDLKDVNTIRDPEGESYHGVNGDPDNAGTMTVNNNGVFVSGNPAIAHSIRLAIMSEGKTTACICPNEEAIPFYTPDGSNPDDPLATFAAKVWLLRDVWSKDAGGVVCNGAHTGCPCYSGKWLHCTNDAMSNGMRVTANQLLEMRFWTYDWPSQTAYDRYFEQRPNWIDDTTADLYTFTQYGKSEVSEGTQAGFDRLMQGQQLHLCMPASVWNKYYDPDIYLDTSDIVFSNTVLDINDSGTGLTNDGEAHFPTLMRDMWSYESFFPLRLIYPFVDDSFDDFQNIGCSRDSNMHNGEFTKYTNNPRYDFVTAIGQTVRAKKVYFINVTALAVSAIPAEIMGALNEQELYEGMNHKEKWEITQSILQAIEYTYINNPAYVSLTKSDTISGAFIADPVLLRINVRNHLLVVVDLENNSVAFRHRFLTSKFCGGVLQQTSFEYSYKPEDSDDPTYQSLMGMYNPPAKAAAEFISFGATQTSDVKAAHSMHIVSAIGEYDEYAYGIVKEDVSGGDTGGAYEWTPIGNSSYVLFYSKHKSLSYIFKWRITEAHMTAQHVDEKALQGPCGSNRTIKMYQMYPTDATIHIIVEGHAYEHRGTPYSATQTQGFLTPGLAVLSPTDEADKFRVYSKLDWELSVDAETYVFQSASEDPADETKPSGDPSSYDNYRGDSTARSASRAKKSIGSDSGEWPPEGASKNVPYTLTVLGGTAKVTDFALGPVGIVGFGTAPDGREVCANAIKVYTYANTVFCRGVEVNHAYRSEAREEILFPAYGYADAPGGGSAGSGKMRHQYYHAPCGDHLLHAYSQEGPMWYPHYRCARADIYEVWAMCAYCASPLDGVPRDDMRFCGTYATSVYGDMPRSNWAGACGIQCYYTYASFPSDTFAGYANLVNSVNENDYIFNHWRLPPFGNFGRSFVDRNLCRDYVIFRDVNHGMYRSAWAPTVIDDTMMPVSFNCFDAMSNTNALDSLTFSDTLNYGVCSEVGEQIGDTRYRWEEIFESRKFLNGAYPKPIVQTPVGKGGFGYMFKDPDTTWAWRELWAPIIKLDQNLTSVHITKPAYRKDIYKVEHRYIISEGMASLSVITDPDETGDSGVGQFSLNGGPPRSFKFLYDSPTQYNDWPLEWLDGFGEERVYEDVNANPNFDTDYNTIFEPGATANEEDAEEAGRMRVVGVDLDGSPIKRYYNRGLIIDMRRRDLLLLPYSTQFGLGCQKGKPHGLPEVKPLSTLEEAKNFGGWAWKYEEDKDGNAIQITMTGSVRDPSELQPQLIVAFPENLYLIGQWGLLKEGHYVCIPKVSFMVSAKDSEDPADFVSLNGIGGFSARADGLIDMESYALPLHNIVTPFRVLNEKLFVFKMILDFVDEESIILSNPNFLMALSYDGSTSELDVRERKYFVSTFSNPGRSPNPDHRDGVLIPRFGCGAPHFPYETSIGKDGYTAMNKMRGIWASEAFEKEVKTPIGISIGTIPQVERGEQEKEYNFALSMDEVEADELNFSAAAPPYFSAIEELLDDVDFPTTISFYDFTFKSPVIPWEELTGYHRNYKVFSHWRPGGHKWGWGGKVVRLNCRIAPPVIRDTEHP